MAAGNPDEPMPSIEERVAYLEGRTGEFATGITDLRSDVRAQFSGVHTEITEVRAEIRDLRGEMIRRFEQVDNKFNWLIGIQFATLLAIIAILGSNYR